MDDKENDLNVVSPMKVFRMNDTDCGRDWIVIAEDIRKGIDLFDKANSGLPEKIRELTADGEQIIIQGLFEPEYDLPF